MSRRASALATSLLLFAASFSASQTQAATSKSVRTSCKALPADVNAPGTSGAQRSSKLDQRETSTRSAPTGSDGNLPHSTLNKTSISGSTMQETTPHAQNAPLKTEHQSRQTVIPIGQYDCEQREAFDAFLQSGRQPGSDGSLGAVFDPWMLNPAMFKGLFSLYPIMWEQTSIGRAKAELVICITAKLWRANVVWAGHTKLALQNGVRKSVLDDIYADRRPLDAPDDALIYDIVTTMHAQKALPRELYDEGVAHIGERGLMEVMAISGYYSLAAMTVNAFEVPVMEGMETPFDRQP